MGQSASAQLVYGVELGEQSELPEWLTKHMTDVEGMDCPVIDKSEAELITYGYYDEPYVALGISIAWALDYTAEEVNPQDTHVVGHALVMVQLLNDLGAPPALQPKLWLLPSLS